MKTDGEELEEGYTTLSEVTINDNDHKAINLGKNNFKIYPVMSLLLWNEVLQVLCKIAGQCLTTMLVSTSQRGCSRTGKKHTGGDQNSERLNQ